MQKGFPQTWSLIVHLSSGPELAASFFNCWQDRSLSPPGRQSIVKCMTVLSTLHSVPAKTLSFPPKIPGVDRGDNFCLFHSIPSPLLGATNKVFACLYNHDEIFCGQLMLRKFMDILRWTWEGKEAL